MHLIDQRTIHALLHTFKLSKAFTEPNIANGEWMIALEGVLLQELLKVGGQLLEEILNTLQSDPIWHTAHITEVYRRHKGELRPHSKRTVKINSLFGVISLHDADYWVNDKRHKPGRPRSTRGRAGGGRYPLLEHLGIFERATPALTDEVARQATQCSSFDEAKQNLASRGLSFNEKTIQRISYGLAERGLTQREKVAEGTHLSTDPQLFAGERVRFGIDGGRSKIRYPNRAGRRKQNKRRGYRVAWREPRLIFIEVIDEQGQRREGTKPMYLTSLGDANTVMKLLKGTLKAYGIEQAAEIIVCADGASWFWERLPDLYDELALDRERITEVLDAYHALEHLGSIKEMGRFESKRAANIWHKKQKRHLFSGHWQAFLKGIDALQIRRGSKKPFRTERAFFLHHRERLRYAEFKRSGIPRGSGAIESAIRQVINLRVKSSGKHWREEHCEEILFLRCQLKTDHWRSFICSLLLDFDLSSEAHSDHTVSSSFNRLAA